MSEPQPNPHVEPAASKTRSNASRILPNDSRSTELGELTGYSRTLAYARLYQRFYRKTKEGNKYRREWTKQYRKTPKAIAIRRAHESTPEFKAIAKERGKKAMRKLRVEILNYYSNGAMECECCREKEYEFLCLDHKNGGGSKHRKEIGVKCGAPFFRWLIKNGLPDGYRVLCHNCNMSLGFHGYCPHDVKRKAVLS